MIEWIKQQINIFIGGRKIYKVFTYEVRSSLLGTNIAKMDKQLEDYLNAQEKLGWILVAMTEMRTDSRNFVYKLVFRKA